MQREGHGEGDAMNLEKREKGQGHSPQEWAKILGIGKKSLLNDRYLKRSNNRLCRSRLWKAMRKWLRPGTSLLDAGCGMGQWVHFFHGQEIAAVELDFSEEMISTLRNRFPRYTWIHGCVQNIALPDDSFDYVLSLGVVEHDPNGPQQALNEFHRILKKGGIAFVSVPLDTPARRKASRLRYNQSNPTAFFFEYQFTVKELSDHMINAGFRVASTVLYTRNLNVVFPRVYLFAERCGRIPLALAHRLFIPIMALCPNSYCMVLAVGIKL
jgi:ubiquinone/menaquinone biosynthesis C-methylase UbiE